jgi:hypothetical protein
MNNTPTSDLAYRFEYADESAFEVYADGRAFITTKSGRREEKFGKITNNVPLLLGRVAKPRQDEIERLREANEHNENAIRSCNQKISELELWNREYREQIAFWKAKAEKL